MSAIPIEQELDRSSFMQCGDALEMLSLGLSDDLAIVESLLEQHTESPVPTIPNVAHHLTGAGGKRLRPLVTIAAARAASPQTNSVPTSVLKLATAVEFIHSATLLHDDVIDGSDTRRGKTAAKNIWGSSASILVGDFLFSRAFTLMVETRSLPVLEILSRASSVIAEGEIRQLAALGRADLQQSEYMAIIDAKTASLFKAAAQAAAMTVTAHSEISTALGNYGHRLGRAFQLADDILDYGGESALLGKAVGDDFREGKITLPLLIARQRANARELSFWERIIRPSEQKDEDLAHAVELIRQSGAMQTALELARQETELACQALQPVPAGPMRDHLQALAIYCVNRAC